MCCSIWFVSVNNPYISDSMLQKTADISRDNKAFLIFKIIFRYTITWRFKDHSGLSLELVVLCQSKWLYDGKGSLQTLGFREAL